MKTIKEYLDDYHCPFCKKDSLHKLVESFSFHPSDSHKRFSCCDKIEIQPDLTYGKDVEFDSFIAMGLAKRQGQFFHQQIASTIFKSIDNYLSKYYGSQLETLTCVSYCHNKCCHITSEFVFEPNIDIEYNFVPWIGQSIYELHYMNPSNHMQDVYFPGKIYKIYSSFGTDSSFEPIKTVVIDFFETKLLESPQEMTPESVLTELEKYKSFM